MDIGNLEYSKIELEKNKFYLFTFLTLVGLIITLIKSNNLLSIVLLLVLIFEIIHIFFSQKYIKIANKVIMHYQKKRVPEQYINKLLEEINEIWDLDWDRFYPILTESMIKEVQIKE